MKNKTFSIIVSAFFTTVIVLLAQTSIITPSVPITLQILGVAICGYTLSLKWALGCVVTYIALGSLGLPVFSLFQGGAQIVLGPTGGFIIGFIFLGVCCSLAQNFNKRAIKLSFGILGVLLCHLIGVIQYSIVSGNSITSSFATSSLPFILKDIILVVMAFYLSNVIRKHLKSFKF